MVQDQAPQSNAGPPIVSDFAHDESMAEIISIFLDEIPRRIDALQRHFQAGERDALCRMVHQLKGAGGGYGFPIISTTAAALEKKIRASEDRWVSTARAPLEEFVNILRRAHAGRSDSRHT
jgi:HPt (histidine-containing phosphotransfer) domain-containing protein